MERINLYDTELDIIDKLAEGNPGAMKVLLLTFKSAETIDPDNIMGQYGPALLLDSYSIYGSDIWVLYKDVCNEDLVLFIGLLRATQLGLVSRFQFIFALEDQLPIDHPEQLLESVRKVLPDFGKVTA
jgi:hypothetical protein